jgi:hypothetical protein
MNTKVHRYTNFLLTLGLVVVVSGCSSTVNWNYARTPSTAFAQPQTTTLGALFQEAAEQHPGLSGFSVVRESEECIKKSGSRGQRSSFLYLKIWIPTAEGSR